MKVTLVTVTPDAEKLMEYCARVSSPHQDKDDPNRNLLRYCFEHRHWSVFEMADMTVEIETSLAIATQILRHKSASFQQFSGRYAVNDLGFEKIHLRRQDFKNRQNSTDDLDEETLLQCQTDVDDALNCAKYAYERMIERGVARECARMILPQCTTTRLYAKNSVRGWIHYLQVRTDPSTQLEHREVALAILEIFKREFPVVGALI